MLETQKLPLDTEAAKKPVWQAQAKQEWEKNKELL